MTAWNMSGQKQKSFLIAQLMEKSEASSRSIDWYDFEEDLPYMPNHSQLSFVHLSHLDVRLISEWRKEIQIFLQSASLLPPAFLQVPL